MPRPSAATHAADDLHRGNNMTNRPIRTLLAAGLALGASAVLYSHARAARGAQDPEAGLVAVGKTAPSFTIPSPAGGQVSLASALHSKKAAIVNFWFVA